VGSLTAEVRSESGEAFGDLDGGEGLGEGRRRTAVVVVPAAIRVDTADAGDGAVEDMHDALRWGRRVGWISHHLRSASSWTVSEAPVSPYRRLVSRSTCRGECCGRRPARSRRPP
jgi:hypothetical protein